MKVYCEISMTGTCLTPCSFKYDIKIPYFINPNIGSLSCQECKNFESMGIDEGGDFVICSDVNRRRER